MIKSLILLAALLFPALPGSRQTQIHGVVQGRILDKDSTGIPGASFHLLGTSMGRVTKPDGSFLLGNVPAGEYRVRVYARMKAERFVDITVCPGDTTRVTVILPDSLIVSDTIRRRPIIDSGPVGRIRRIDRSELLPTDTGRETTPAIDTSGSTFLPRNGSR